MSFFFQDCAILQILSAVLYECVTREKPEAIMSLLGLNQVKLLLTVEKKLPDIV